MLVLDIAYTIYMKFEEFPRALQIALYLDNMQVCTTQAILTSMVLKLWSNFDQIILYDKA